MRLDLLSKVAFPVHVAMTCSLLAACATHKDVAATLPVAISCVSPNTPNAPKIHTPEQLRLVPDDASFVTMTSADYQALYAWMILAVPVIEACRTAGPPP